MSGGQGPQSSHTDLPLFARSMPGRCAALRDLLRDGKWHLADKLRQVAGWRYGARLHEVRQGQDGGPCIVVEVRAYAGSHEYRQVTP
ncbi:MAG: hypothetical protein IPO09_19050 [Anaeromyxobacter sp.]|nr:hypothetical protein [Anaeromyxobacter sp.]MBL0276004.1 hypothetical protein [Anaeromyxobacter sp.]